MSHAPVKRRPVSARAATDYTPGSYPATTVPSAPMLHLLDRFSYGATPDLVAEATKAGGQQAWFQTQISYGVDATAKSVAQWWPDLNRSPIELFRRNAYHVRPAWAVMMDYVNRTLTRRIISPRPLVEVMQEFFEHHLHVPLGADLAFCYRPQYGDLIRANCLGRFEDMLVGALNNPAMLLYLNAINSEKTHPNENLARELLELHTVGVGNYSESDVKNAARLMTGFTINVNTGALTYKTSAHDTSPVTVGSFSDPNANPDGRAAYTAMLRYLANHPDTARRIATKMVVRFVSDDAPAALVDKLTAVYLANGTAIVPMLQALVSSDEFAASAGRKLRDPAEDLVVAMRRLGATFSRPLLAKSPANLLCNVAAAMGLIPYTWPSPDGQPLVGAAWATPSRAAASLQVHTRMATLSYPATVYPRASSFLPPLPIAFKDLVDHLHRRIHQRPSDARALQACCEATGVAPTDSITTKHTVVTSGFATLLGTLLDLPPTFQR